MTPRQISEACKTLAAEIGPRAYVSVYAGGDKERGDHGGQADLTVYPNGILDKCRFSVTDETWEGLFAKAREAWNNQSSTYDLERIQVMALKIIEITDRLGRCTVSALRTEFDPSDILRLGSKATEAANRMAGRGPFSIIDTPHGNRRDGDTDEEGC